MSNSGTESKKSVLPKQDQLSSKNWLPKAMAGVLAGFFLALGITGIFLRFGFGDIFIFSSQGQFLMWILTPIWLAILSACFMFRNGLSAWIYLVSANGLVWAPLVLL